LQDIKFIDVCCSLDNAVHVVVALSNEGSVYYWSWGTRKQAPTLISATEYMEIVAISCSVNFISMLSNKGQVYTYVLNDKLPVERTASWARYEKFLGNVEVPTEHRKCGLYKENITNAVQLSCNSQNLIILIGKDKIGVLDPIRTKFSILRYLKGHSIRQLKCSETHIVAVCQNGHLYTWGKGPLGIGKEAADTPILVQMSKETLLAGSAYCDSFTTIILEDYMASNLAKWMLGKSADVKTITSMLLTAPRQNVSFSLKLAYANFKSYMKQINEEERNQSFFNIFMSSRVQQKPPHLEISQEYISLLEGIKIVNKSESAISIEYSVCYPPSDDYNFFISNMPSSLLARRWRLKDAMK